MDEKEKDEAAELLFKTSEHLKEELAPYVMYLSEKLVDMTGSAAREKGINDKGRSILMMTVFADLASLFIGNSAIIGQENNILATSTEEYMDHVASTGARRAKKALKKFDEFKAQCTFKHFN